MGKLKYAFLFVLIASSMAHSQQPPCQGCDYLEQGQANQIYKIGRFIGGYPVLVPSLLSDNGTTLLYNGSPIGGGGGSGTVTNVSATGNAIVGVTVLTPTTTPQLIFTIPNAPANSVFGNFTGSAAAGTYSAAPVFSGAGLTALNASALTTGTVAVGLLPIAGASTNGIVRADGSTITNTGGLGVLTAVGSALTGLNASNISTGTLAAARVPTLAVTGGTIDGTAIGQTTPANGAFLSLLSNAVNFGGGTIDNVTIGGSTAVSGKFTTATATSFVGPLTGNVTGNVSGSAATATTAGALTCGTALGDLSYFNTATTMACLPGNTTAAVKILGQTGNGTISAAPAWLTVTGTGAPVLGTAPTITGATITTGSINNTPIGAATRSTVQATTVNATSTVVGSNIMAGEGVVAFSATPTFSSATTQSQIMTLTANVTAITMAAGVAGRGLTITLCQNATGGFTAVGAPANLRGFGTIGTTASTCSSQHFTYSGNQTAWIADSAMVINE